MAEQFYIQITQDNGRVAGVIMEVDESVTKGVPIRVSYAVAPYNAAKATKYPSRENGEAAAIIIKQRIDEDRPDCIGKWQMEVLPIEVVGSTAITARSRSRDARG